MNKYVLDKQLKLKYDEGSDKYYAFCIESGDHFELNKAGYLILNFLSKPKSVEDIIEFIPKDINTKSLDVRKDTLTFLKISEKNGIIVKTKTGKNETENKN